MVDLADDTSDLDSAYVPPHHAGKKRGRSKRCVVSNTRRCVSFPESPTYVDDADADGGESSSDIIFRRRRKRRVALVVSDGEVGDEGEALHDPLASMLDSAEVTDESEQRHSTQLDVPRHFITGTPPPSGIFGWSLHALVCCIVAVDRYSTSPYVLASLLGRGYDTRELRQVDPAAEFSGLLTSPRGQHLVRCFELRTMAVSKCDMEDFGCDVGLKLHAASSQLMLYVQLTTKATATSLVSQLLAGGPDRSDDIHSTLTSEFVSSALMGRELSKFTCAPNCESIYKEDKRALLGPVGGLVIRVNRGQAR
jgi:hypothetical protein